MSDDGPTPFVEANLFLAAQEGNTPVSELVREIRRQLLPGEIQALSRGTVRLALAAQLALEQLGEDPSTGGR